MDSAVEGWEWRHLPPSTVSPLKSPRSRIKRQIRGDLDCNFGCTTPPTAQAFMPPKDVVHTSLLKTFKGIPGWWWSFHTLSLVTLRGFHNSFNSVVLSSHPNQWPLPCGLQNNRTISRKARRKLRFLTTETTALRLRNVLAATLGIQTCAHPVDERLIN